MAGRFLVPPAMRSGFKPNKASFSEIGEQAGNDAKKIGEHLKENYNPRDPLFMKDEKTGRNINNLFTGYKLGGKGKLLAAGSMLGGGAIYVANPHAVNRSVGNHMNTKAQSEELDVESLQSTRSDGQGYQASIGASATANLTTSGDLVFAMHKTRHSGQL